jgi:hypothetical protein
MTNATNPETNSNRIGGSSIWARRQQNPKPNSHPEDGEVIAAGIWDEGGTTYPGRSVSLPSATVIEK